MKSAMRITASALGVYAAIVGIAHGYYETLQGNVTPGGISINAIGPPCRTNAVWHGCLPAMTIIPNFSTTGILTIIVGSITLIWAFASVQGKHGGIILILLSLLLLLVGGGYPTDDRHSRWCCRNQDKRAPSLVTKTAFWQRLACPIQAVAMVPRCVLLMGIVPMGPRNSVQ